MRVFSDVLRHLRAWVALVIVLGTAGLYLYEHPKAIRPALIGLGIVAAILVFSRLAAP